MGFKRNIAAAVLFAAVGLQTAAFTAPSISPPPCNAICNRPRTDTTFAARKAHGDDDAGGSGRKKKVRAKPAEAKEEEGGIKARLARARASLLAERRAEEESKPDEAPPARSFRPSYAKRLQGSMYAYDEDSDARADSSFDLIDLTQKIDQKILANNRYRSGWRRRADDDDPGREIQIQHETSSMSSLLGYNQVEGEWNDRNATTYQIAIVFGKALINDQVTNEYAIRLQTLAKMLRDEPSFRPSLDCFTGGVTGENSISDASAGYVYFRHLCAIQNIPLDDAQTKFWVDVSQGGNERDAMERIASELWRNYIKGWLNDRPLTERLNQHCEYSAFISECHCVIIYWTLTALFSS